MEPSSACVWLWLEPSPPRPKIALCCVVACERAVGEDAVAAEIPMLALRLRGSRHTCLDD